MFQNLRLALLILFYLCTAAAPAHAGNACPASVPAGITNCYYIDYASGADSNSGASESSPWKHAPGMLGLTPSGGSTGDGCTGSCASNTPVAGNGYILKGGTVWPYTVLPWQPPGHGTGTTSTYGCTGSGCIYVGYDPTWNQGKVNSVTLLRDLGGCNPAAPPTVVFSGGGGNGAAATTSVIPAAAAAVEPNVGGLVYLVTITSQGSGYTSNPSVTIGGSGCNGITAVADIERPVIDAGGTQGVDWPVGTGAGALIWGPGVVVTGNYYIIDHLEVRNILQQMRTNSFETGMIGDQGGGQNTFSNNYVHGRTSDCMAVTNSCDSSGANGGQQDRAINMSGNDEVNGNFLSNGESFFLGTASNFCGSYGSRPNNPCEFSEAGIGGIGSGGEVQNNHGMVNRWMVHLGVSSPGMAPVSIHGNEFWLNIYDEGGAHINQLYIANSTGQMYEYNNVWHNAVAGSSNQQQMSNGTTEYFFNNVNWALGGGTPNWAVDTQNGAGPNASFYYFYNNTMVSGPTAGTEQCINSGGSAAPQLTVVLQNNQCISSLNPYFGNNTGSVYQNQAGSTSSSAIQAASVVDSLSAATSQGYTAASVFAPSATNNDTVAFASSSNSANLTSLCTGYLVPLCSDINGNPRPSSGGWQAGAYLYGGTNTSSESSQSSSLLPPTGLTAIVH
jgi:hypothetical protein